MTAVRDIMTPNPTSVSDGMLASEAAQIMLDADVGFLPVLRDGKVLGIVTDRDIATRAMPQAGDVPISDIMTRGAITISPDAAVEEAERVMSEHGVRRLMVCEGSEVVGVVSIGDLAVRVSDSLAGGVLHETGPSEEVGGRSLDVSPDEIGPALDVGGEIEDLRSITGRPAGIDLGETVDDLLEESRPADEGEILRIHDRLDSINRRGEYVPGGSDSLGGEHVLEGDDPLEGDAEFAGSRIFARHDGIARDDEANGEFGQG